MRKNVPRQHKRLQRAKFLSAVGKEETGAVVYREVGCLSPCSPFSPPCQHCMTATSRPGLPLDLPRFFPSELRLASLCGPCRRPLGWVPGSRETGSRPRRRTTAGCHHLASTCGPAPKALIVAEGRNHGRGGEQSTRGSGCSLPRHPWDAAQGWCGAHRQAHPASRGQVAPALPAPAPVGAALWQLQLLEAVSTSSAPSTCQPRRLQGHLGAGTRSPCQRRDGHPSYQGCTLPSLGRIFPCCQMPEG